MNAAISQTIDQTAEFAQYRAERRGAFVEHLHGKPINCAPPVVPCATGAGEPRYAQPIDPSDPELFRSARAASLR